MPRPAGRGTIISIHVLRVEDDAAGRAMARKGVISIHVLRVEDDSKNREKSLFAFIIIQQFVQICN